MANALVIHHAELWSGGLSMNMHRFREAVAMAQARQHVWISTADALGVPHIASVGAFSVRDDNTIVLSDWSCPLTLSNLADNQSIAIVVWDVNKDQGYQMLGQVKSIDLLEHAAGNSGERAIVGEHQLCVKPHRVLSFSHAPHDDLDPIPLGMAPSRRGASLRPSS